jgi:hypothetical protein
MKDLRPEEPVELIEMRVPIGWTLNRLCLIVESLDETGATEDEADPPPPFEYTRWGQ